MSPLQNSATTASPVAHGPDPNVPRWVGATFADRRDQSSEQRFGGLSVRTMRERDFMLVTVVVRGASSLPPVDFQQMAAAAYQAVAEQCRRRPGLSPVRFWNFIPRIRTTAPDGIDRYMVFNAGRYKAYCDWLGGADTFDRTVATATAVGYEGDDLIVHMLATDRQCLQVDNPRQIQPHRYSARFGPFPPCFARATVVRSPAKGSDQLILVGGTSSVVGEESVHVGDPANQTRVTFENLSTLVRSACTASGAIDCEGGADPATWLARFRDMRVYYVRRSDLDAIRDLVREYVPHLGNEVEYVHVDLCRADLLVEIEGTALGGPVAG